MYKCLFRRFLKIVFSIDPLVYYISYLFHVTFSHFGTCQFIIPDMIKKVIFLKMCDIDYLHQNNLIIYTNMHDWQFGFGEVILSVLLKLR